MYNTNLEKTNMKPIKQRDIMAELAAPLPPEALAPDQSTGLTNIVSAYEVERLNQVFGVAGWTTESERVNLDREKGEICIYMTFRAGDIVKRAHGGNDHWRLGDALKSADTDALGKICYQLGIGLDIYKTRADFRLEKDGAPKDTGKPQYTSISGIVTQVVESAAGTWLQVNGQLCFAKAPLSERLDHSAVNHRIAANAAWWWPDKKTPVLRLTGILEIAKIEDMEIPEIIEPKKRGKSAEAEE
jgi:hypothetical protein